MKMDLKPKHAIAIIVALITGICSIAASYVAGKNTGETNVRNEIGNILVENNIATDYTSLNDTIVKLVDANGNLNKSNADLQKDNAILEEQKKVLSEKNLELESEISRLKSITSVSPVSTDSDMATIPSQPDAKDPSNQPIRDTHPVQASSVHIVSHEGYSTVSRKDTFGNSYPEMISLAANHGYVEYHTEGKFNKFTCMVAPKTGVNSISRKINVYCDDLKIYTSPDWISYKTEPHEITVDIEGARIVKIECIPDDSTSSYYTGLILGDLTFYP